MIKHSKLIILGSGPAGCTAAIYAARANLSPILVTGSNEGGQLSLATVVENWPGDSSNPTGLALMQKISDHVKKLNVEVVYDHINTVNLYERPFHLKGNYEYTADAIIIATGSSARKLDIPSEEVFRGKGVSTCAVCDGYFYRNKKVAVIGGGNTAVEEALYLSSITDQVYLIHRTDKFRAEAIMIDRLMEKVSNHNIVLRTNFTVKEIIGNSTGVTAVRIISNLEKNKDEIIEISGCFIAIGYDPNTTIFEGQLEMKNRYIKIGLSTNGNYTQTSILGVFAAGDVVDYTYKQAITSAGSGCMAALDAKKFLDSINN